VQLIEFTDANFYRVHHLADESKREGFDFVKRTIDDWHSRTNNFSKPGEKLWGLVAGTELIGIGGLNRDPYTKDVNAGRVRHLYIRQTYRRMGYATLLMNAIISQARRQFTVLRLFTDNPVASEFYKKLGFQTTTGDKVSHVLILAV
jgi:GNAT superfamily N-acetyltransferase